MLYGAIEAGGTKIICATGTDDARIRERERIDTLSPDKTIPAIIDFFSRNKVGSIGIGTFGPADIDEKSPTYGYITSTPKAGWKNFNFRGTLVRELGVDVAFDTDVNAAVLGEYLWGAARNCVSAVYITVGTGVGAGAIVDGKILKGISHPEMGHMLVRRHADDNFAGVCPYHRDCVEGLSSGPSISARCGRDGAQLDGDDPVWEYISYYLAQMMYSIALVLMPGRFIAGGGVLANPGLLAKIRTKFLEISASYLQFDSILREIDSYIAAPQLGSESGIKGALGLAIAKARTR